MSRLTGGILTAAGLCVASAQIPGEAFPACAPDGIAVGGYDVVSYYSVGGPVPGLPQVRVELAGLTYLFLDAENRDRFLARPDDFLPAYGGWCATTVALGALLCPDFSNFKIEDGRLLLFEVTAFTNGRALWDTNPGGYRRRADANYDRLLQE